MMQLEWASTLLSLRYPAATFGDATLDTDTHLCHSAQSPPLGMGTGSNPESVLKESGDPSVPGAVPRDAH